MFANVVAYVLAFLLILGALAVVTSRNPVHSVLFLIFSFFNAAGVFLFLKAEFLAMVLVIVYVGAVAILFLFVVMLVKVDSAEKRKILTRYFILSLVLVVLLGVELIFFIKTGLLEFKSYVPALNINKDISSIKSLGIVLYEEYYYVFIISALILTVAMIGAVLLASKEEETINQIQNIAEQNSRNRANSLRVVKVNKEEGIK